MEFESSNYEADLPWLIITNVLDNLIDLFLFLLVTNVIMNTVYIRIWKESVVFYLNVGPLHRHSLGGTEENHEKPQA